MSDRRRVNSHGLQVTGLQCARKPFKSRTSPRLRKAKHSCEHSHNLTYVFFFNPPRVVICFHLYHLPASSDERSKVQDRAFYFIE